MHKQLEKTTKNSDELKTIFYESRGNINGENYRGANHQEAPRRSKNLHKFKIAPFYASDVELWFNQLETQFDLHDITDDDKRYRLTCAALSRKVASDVRDILLQPFLSHKYISLKGVLIERRGLTTPERVNKVISGEKLGTDIPSRFLRRLQKTTGFGKTAVVGKAVIRQAFIRQMPASIGAHLATTPDSTSFESLAVLADRAIVSENDAKDNSVGVAEVRVNDSEKLIRIMEDISRRLKLQDIKRNIITISSRQLAEETIQQKIKKNSLTLMRDRLHLAWLQIIIVMKKMTKMLLPQKYQIPARPLRRRTRRKPIPHSQRLRTMH